MTTTTTPRPTAAQARALTAAADRSDGIISTSTHATTVRNLVARGWAILVPADDRPLAPVAITITDAGRAAIGAPTVDGRTCDCAVQRTDCVCPVGTPVVTAEDGYDQAAVDQAAVDMAAVDMATDAAVGAAIARRETADGAPRLLSIGTRVRTDDDRTGTVVAGSLWTVNVAEGRDPGDRVVSMDATGERLIWDRQYLTVLSGPVVVNGAACDTPRVLAVETAATVRGAAQYPGREPERVTVPAGTVVTVLPHPVPGYVALIGERADDAVAFIIGAVRAEQLDTYAPVASDDTLPTDDYVTPRVMVDYPGLGTPAVSCPAVWTGGLVCTRDDDHADDDHRTTLFGRPVTFTYGTSAPVAEGTPAVAAETTAAPSGRARSAERTTFLADVLCAALEGGIGYWSAADAIVRVSEATGQPCGSDAWPWRYDAVTLFETADGDDACSVTDGPCQGHRVTLDTVATAVNKISKTKRADCPAAGGFHYGYVNTVRDASMENDGGEIDADVADIIVQVAALGSVVYG